jgi:Xaa-Pro dipeptidase
MYFVGYLPPKYGWLSTRIEQLVYFLKGETCLFCSESLTAAAKMAYADNIVTYMDYDIHSTTEVCMREALAPLRKELESHEKGIRKIGLAYDRTALEIQDMLNAVFPGAVFSDIGGMLREMHRLKDHDEIDLIARTCEVSGRLYIAAAAAMAHGRKETDLYAACQAAYASEIPGWFTLAGDFVSGPRTLEMGGAPTERVLESSDTVILDLWIEPFGYWADNARSFIVGGNPTPEQRRLHELVIASLEIAESLLVPGTKASDVYYSICESFEREGVLDYFPLHAGHGIGLSPHEAPLFIPGSNDRLEAGMVCTLEPGLYVPEVGGLRCEDNYYITADGPKRLTGFSRRISWR